MPAVATAQSNSLTMLTHFLLYSTKKKFHQLYAISITENWPWIHGP